MDISTDTLTFRRAARAARVVAPVLAILLLVGCGERTYSRTVWGVDKNGNVVATEQVIRRPPPKPLEGGDTSCTICGF